jgi:hypothetical protein
MLHVGMAEDLIPVRQVVDFDTLPWVNHCLLSGGTRKRGHEKGVIIHDAPVLSVAAIG